jgi:predicted lipid-binding transport protein (Tim44 family)
MNYAQPPPQQVYAAPPVYAPQSMATPPAPPRASSNAGVWIGVIAGLLIGGTAFFALVFWR